MVSASSAANTSRSEFPDALTSSGRNALSLQPRGTTSPISSSVTPPSSQRPRTPSQILVTSSEPGRFLRTFSPIPPEGSARTAGSVATNLPTDADILLASADNIPHPPAPVDKLACACWWGSIVSRSAIHPTTITPPFQEAPEVFKHLHCVIICPSTSWQGQLWVHHSLAIRRSLHHRDYGYEICRFFIRYS